MSANEHGKFPPGTPPEHILKALAIGVIAVDPKMCITYLNHAASEVAGISQKEALGMECCDVFKSSLCDGECPIQAAFQTRENQYNRDAVFIRQDGRSVVPVKLSALPGDGRGRRTDRRGHDRAGLWPQQDAGPGAGI